MVLSWEQQPQAPNDDFVDAEVISGPSGSVPGSTGPGSVATREPGEFAIGNFDATSTIWYRWTAPADGEVAIDTCDASFDTLLAVSAGDSRETLTQVAFNNDGCDAGGGSNVVFDAVEGAVYQITVDGKSGQIGDVVLDWVQGTPVFAPAAPTVSAVAGWHAATFTITPGGDGGSPVTAYEVTLRNGDAVVDTATVPAEGDLSVTFGDLATGTTYTASAVATNVADDSAPGTVSAAPFVPADTTALTIGGRACPAGSSITWKVVNSLDIPVDFNWFARTAQSAGAGVVEAGASTEITTAFVGPTRNVFQVQVDRVLQVRARSLLTRNCPVVAT